MPKTSAQIQSTTSRDEAASAHPYNANGLLEACKTRFAPPAFEVSCDVRRTVWVKRADGSRSVGLPQWYLNQHSLSEALERVESKLGIHDESR